MIVLFTLLLILTDANSIIIKQKTQENGTNILTQLKPYGKLYLYRISK